MINGCRELLPPWTAPADLVQPYGVRLEPGETKNDEGRPIPLVGDLYELLKLQKETRDRYFPNSPWVFSRRGDPILNFRGAWDSACKTAGLVSPNGDNEKPTRLFHDFRRTGVRNLIGAGVPEKVAMLISGHKTRSVFDRYNIVNDSDLKELQRNSGSTSCKKQLRSRPRHQSGALLAHKTPDRPLIDRPPIL